MYLTYTINKPDLDHSSPAVEEKAVGTLGLEPGDYRGVENRQNLASEDSLVAVLVPGCSGCMGQVWAVWCWMGCLGQDCPDSD